MNALAPVVTSLENQARPHTPLDVFGLAEAMRPFAGEGLSQVIDAAWETRNIIDTTLAGLQSGGTRLDLLGSSSEDLSALVRSAAHDQATTLLDPAGYSPAKRVDIQLTDQLEREMKEALKPHADEVVERLRPDFDAHVEVVKAAAKVGIDADTDAADLAATGTKAQLDAFRGLGQAVAGLEQIARLRNAITETLNYGPVQWPALAFVTGIETAAALESLESRYADVVETAQYHQAFTGAAFVQVRKDRLGGRWLHMVHGQYALRLNTAAEATAVLNRASGTSGTSEVA
jgi:hypothetical protein